MPLLPAGKAQTFATLSRRAERVELHYVVPPSAQPQDYTVNGVGLKRKRSGGLDGQHHYAEAARDPIVPAAPIPGVRDCRSSSSTDGVIPLGLATTIDNPGFAASQAERSETGLPLTPESFGEELDVGGLPVSITSTRSDDGLSLDDRLLSTTPELPVPRSLCAEAIPFAQEDEADTRSDDEEPTELILAELSQIASQRHTDASSDTEAFLPPDSTALWIAASSQVERAEQSFFHTKAHARRQLGAVANEQALPTPVTSFEQPSGPAALPSYQLSWRREPVVMPPDAVRVYAVRRGRRPGFYFAYEGLDGVEAQVIDFKDCLYQWFVIDEDGLDEACDFLNHAPTECRHSCDPPCRKPEQENPDVLKRPSEGPAFFLPLNQEAFE
ncbi:hypothetical protein LTR85_010375 [Meristemomyces frigidus]|nr:hypothetical protein LTR85_010375 [Meristemomyces frigidus]